MQDLTVIGNENGALLVSAPDGTRFRIAIDETLHSTLRGAQSSSASDRRIAPREIQTHIRSGMSAEEVATITGTSVDYIRKFEGPVLAEREFIVESALNVPVRTAIDIDPSAASSTFGSVIRDRLADLGASGERWASWKEVGGGWIVKLEFTADEIGHDARWTFEPRKSALSPLNTEANTLSQQGEMPGGLIPRLRAVSGDERAADSSRFDSGAFDVGPVRTSERESSSPESANTESHGVARASLSSPEVSAAAINRAPAEQVASNQTADLLDALRRRRGERESAAAWEDGERDEETSRRAHPSTGSIRLVDVPLDTFDDLESEPVDTAQQPAPVKQNARKGRASMPSWDEIVFGARSDDDPA
ncbi:septation protein SepH [Marisediminicola sp. LYQ134]|uniref:septation protein SepH n=1 Tax=unclassified Marisediminicola TaxID=2618316 RepID=UPI0039837B5C